MQKMHQKDWTIVISPQRRWFDIDLKNLWRYRDLFLMYIKRDIIVVYKQTILGPLWYIIQPALTTIMYMFIFGGLAGISTDGVPQPLFYLAGITLWNYYSAAFTASSNVFTENANIFGKVYFPRLIVPLSAITSNLVKMLIQLMLFIAVYVYYLLIGTHATINWSILLFPFYIVLLAFHAMGCGLIISALTTKYRDLTFLVSFGIQLFMYATPVIYPMSTTSGKIKTILELNPLTPIFEGFKHGCLGCGSLSWGGLLYSSIFMLILLCIAVVTFTRVERNFMDTV